MREDDRQEDRIKRYVDWAVGISTYLILDKLNHIEHKIDRILRLEHKEMADLTRISDEVAQNTDAVASAISLLAQLADEIRNAGTDQAALDELANALDSNSQALADAVVANTPAAPEA